MHKIVQVTGLVLLSSVFLLQAYTILTEPEKTASKLFKQYADFRIWSNKAQRSWLGGSTMLEFPSSEKVKPYKLKATYIMAYINLLGSLGMVIGEQMMIIPLMIVHLLQSFIKNNPFPLHPVADQVAYENKLRMWVIDMILFFALLIVLLEKHPLGGDSGKSSKVKKPAEGAQTASTTQ